MRPALVGAGLAGLAILLLQARRRLAVVRHAPPSPGTWANWSRHQSTTVQHHARPTHLDDIARLVTEAPTPIRAAGSGHSFTALVPTPGTVVTLERMPQGVEVAGDVVWLPAGMPLRTANVELHERGLALPNLGDIDVQTVAGATATGTHGTGPTFTCLSGGIRGIELIDGRGRHHVMTDADDPDVLDAARVSLGALGIVTRVGLQTCPAYRLRRTTSLRPTQDVVATAFDRWDQHRNFEFMVVPQSGMSLCITHDETNDPVTARPPGQDDQLLMLMKLLRDVTGPAVGVRRAILRLIGRTIREESVVDYSHRLFPSPRNVYFNEMEYHLPASSGMAALRDVLACLEQRHPEIWFPVEVRLTGPDSGWLSPFNDGPRVSVAIHSYFEQPVDFMYGDIEPIFRQHGGRPHWGKLHSLRHRDVVELYPAAERFCDLRRELDPAGVFLNDHLKGLLLP